MYLKFMQELMEANGVPVHRLSLPLDDSTETALVDLGLREEILKTPASREALSSMTSQFEERTVYYITDEFLCGYTAFLIPDSNECFLAGPMLF